MNRKVLWSIFNLTVIVLLLPGCSEAPIPPTNIPVPPTAEVAPPTNTPFSPTATPILLTATPEGAKQIKLIYVEGDKPIQGIELWLSYYDENTQTWMTQNKITDEDGTVTFVVPGGKSGESYTFTFALSESDVEKFVNEIKGGERLGLRIPPDSSRKILTIRTDKDLNISTVDGSVQLWVP